MCKLFICLILILACCGFAHGNEPASASNIDTVVVCAPELLQAASQWIHYRKRQGHNIELLSRNVSKEETKQEIKRVAKSNDLKCVVLIGDAPAHEAKNGAQVETDQVASKVIRRWGAEPTFATDNYYADINQDGTPELAVGRITADTPSQLIGITSKIIAYEQSNNVGPWRRRVNFIAGVGGFGVLADKILESTAKQFITDGIPSEFRTSMTQASWRSPYSPDPRQFQNQTIERMNQGCLAWIYLGHGRKRELDFYRVPDGGVPIFSSHEIPKVHVREGSPIAVFLSCYAGAFDAEPDCLAEELLINPGGPVAVIAGSNVTMPYAMTVMGNAMLHELFEEQRATLGEVLLYAKQELAKPTGDNPQGMIDKLAKVMSPDPHLLDEERAEHVRLFHLIGDPLLRIRHPKSVTIDLDEYGTSGDSLEVKGTSELDGPCVIELVCRRDRLTFRPSSRPKFEFKNDWLLGLQETYARANNTVWASANHTIQGGEFRATLNIPGNATGPSHVRVYVQGEQDFAMGSSDIYLRLPLAEETPDTSQPSGETTVSQSLGQ